METTEKIDIEAEADAITATALVSMPSKAVIETEADCPPWTTYMNDQASCRKRIETAFKPLKDAAHQRHRRICDKEKAMLAEFVAGETLARGKLRDFAVAEERRRAEEQARLDEIAKQEALAEAEAAGDNRLAKQIAADKVPVVSDIVVAAPVKIAGLSVKKVLVANVVDKIAFMRDCMARKNGLRIDLIEVNTKELNKLVNAMPVGTRFGGVVIAEEVVDRRTGRVL